MFFSPEKYDLSAVGRMKFNRRLRRDAVEGPGVVYDGELFAKFNDENSKGLFAQFGVSTPTSLEVVREIIAIRNGEQQTDDIDHLGNRRIRAVGEMTENVFRTGLVRVERAVRERLALAEAENLTPQDLINAKPVSARDQGVLRFVAAVAVHGPEQPAVGGHAQASRVRPRPGRPDARARQLRSPRRAPDPLRPRLPD